MFSGLDADYAGSIEDEFAAHGCAVLSNAKNNRMDSDVPILSPPVNQNYLSIIPAQRVARDYDTGIIITVANCSKTAMAIVQKPIQEKFGLYTVIVTTMQAISACTCWTATRNAYR